MNVKKPMLIIEWLVLTWAIVKSTLMLWAAKSMPLWGDERYIVNPDCFYLTIFFPIIGMIFSLFFKKFSLVLPIVTLLSALIFGIIELILGISSDFAPLFNFFVYGATFFLFIVSILGFFVRGEK